MLLRYTVPLFFAILLVNCTHSNQNTETIQKPIAKVNDNVLYTSDVQDIVPLNSSPKDSAEIVDRYVTNWVRKQLLFSQAQEQLSLNNPDIERKVEDYRYSLYIFELKKKLMDSRLDSNVSEMEINEYYAKESADFLLQSFILKGLMIRIPMSVSMAERTFKNQLSISPLPVEAITQFCAENQFLLRNSLGSWQEGENFLAGTPFKLGYLNQVWKNGKPYLTVQDKEFLYLLKITDLKKPTEPAPIDFVKGNIKAIIINKRKLAIANELEDQLFNEAVKKNKVEISYKPFSANEK